MSAHYYVVKLDIASDLDDVESLALFFKESKLRSGELFVKDISGVKIKYNIKTGNVKMVGVDNPQNVTNFFSSEAFQNYTQPIADAICLLAKIRLLINLDNFKETEISNLIHKNHFNSKTQKLTNLNLPAIDKTLGQIQRYIGLTYKSSEKNEVLIALYKVFKTHLIDTIKSTNDVTKIMIKVKKEIRLQKEKNISAL